MATRKPNISEAKIRRMERQFSKLRSQGISRTTAAKQVAELLGVATSTVSRRVDPKSIKWFKRYEAKHRAVRVVPVRKYRARKQAFKAEYLAASSTATELSTTTERFVAPAVQMIRVVVESNGTRRMLEIAGVKPRVVFSRVREAIEALTH